MQDTIRARLQLNGEPVSYLIHGQSFTLKIEAKRCLFLIIHHEGGKSVFHRWAIRSPHTEYRIITNIHAPVIRAWGIGWGIKKLFEKRLWVEHLNVMQQNARLRTPKVRTITMPDMIHSFIYMERLTCRLKGHLPAFRSMNKLKISFKPFRLHPNALLNNSNQHH